MSMDDLSYLQALMGMTAAEEAAGDATGGVGGVWVVDPDGVAAAAAYGVAAAAAYGVAAAAAYGVAADDAMLRLVGKARVVADALGSYVYLLACGGPADEAARDGRSMPAPTMC